MNETERSRTGTKGPAEWESEQLETDDGKTESAPTGESAPADRARWNKGTMGEERADHTRSPLAGDEELGDSGGALSGGGANPGGGERWADREKS
jgi:hypothetical protein